MIRQYLCNDFVYLSGINKSKIFASCGQLQLSTCDTETWQHQDSAPSGERRRDLLPASDVTGSCCYIENIGGHSLDSTLWAERTRRALVSSNWGHRWARVPVGTRTNRKPCSWFKPFPLQLEFSSGPLFKIQLSDLWAFFQVKVYKEEWRDFFYHWLRG